MSRLGLIQSAAYMVEGLPLFLLNLIIICAVLRHPLLRQRNTSLLLASMAAADALTSLAFALRGRERFVVHWEGRQKEMVPVWSCLKTIASAAFAPIDVTYGLIQMSVTLDRFLSVFDPLRHGGLGRGYVYTLIFASQAPAVPAFAYSLYEGYQTRENATISPLCLPMHLWPAKFYSSVSLAWLMLMTLSSILYVVIIAKLKMTKTELSGTQQSSEERLQRKVTISLGLSSMGTFILMVLPIFAQMAFLKMNFPPSFFGVFIPIRGVCVCLSMGLNFFIFTLRHRDIRTAVKFLFLCKELTVNNVQTTHHKKSQISKKPSNFEVAVGHA